MADKDSVSSQSADLHDLGVAIKDLINEYEKSLRKPNIRYPLSNALYNTWKKHDLLDKKLDILSQKGE